MGYDVYLSWEGMDDESKKAQSTMWDLESGHIGYLRAANWMRNEVRFLDTIFPQEYWLEDREKSGEPLPYDFNLNFSKMKKTAKAYLKAAGARRTFEELVELPVRGRIPREEEDNDKREIIDYPTDYLTWADTEGWIRSVIDFFRLGLKKQEEGKHPKVVVA